MNRRRQRKGGGGENGHAGNSAAPIRAAVMDRPPELVEELVSRNRSALWEGAAGNPLAQRVLSDVFNILEARRQEDEIVRMLTTDPVAEEGGMIAEGFPERSDFLLDPGVSGSDRYSFDYLSYGIGSIKPLRGLLEAKYQNMQRLSQILWTGNTHFRGIIETIVNYAVGQEVVVTFEHPDDATQKEAETVWNRLKDRPRFEWDQRCEEFVRRALRDGDSFVRFFDNKGVFRFIDAEDVRQPRDKTTGVVETDHLNYSFGIETEAADVESVQAYWALDQRIDASEVMHVKIGVDLNEKRGIPFLWTPLRLIRRYATWLEDRIILNKVRTAIVLIRKHTGAASGALGRMADRNKSGTMKAPASGGGTRDVNLETVFAGTIVDAPEGVEYEYKSPDVQAQDVQADGRAILLAIAVSVNMPEYMVSGDASNANYSSTQVAEAPGALGLLKWQAFFCRRIAMIVKRLVVVAMSLNESAAAALRVEVAGPNIAIRDGLKETQRNQIRRQNGVIDLRTWREEEGLDNVKIEERLQEEQLNAEPSLPAARRSVATGAAPPPPAGEAGMPPPRSGNPEDATPATAH